MLNVVSLRWNSVECCLGDGGSVEYCLWDGGTCRMLSVER